tara:strand:- start:121 stop:720 length:600 start_codon:yes stop_codon:yes gene_type:complete
MSTLKVNTLQKADGSTFPFDYPKVDSGSGTSGGSALVFDNLDLTTYRAFDLILTYVPDSDNKNAAFRFRTGGSSGSDLSLSNYAYGINFQYPDASSGIISRQSENHVEIGENIGSGTEEGIHVQARIHFATSSDTGDLARLTNRMDFNANRRIYTGDLRFDHGIGIYNNDDTTYPTGFTFYFIGANVGAYIYCLYGIKR